MLSHEENELLTRVGPGTPMGDLLRCFWQPVVLAEELPPGGAPLPVRLLGEDLVLFRDDRDRLGLLGLHCSHRGADLSYGRCEDGGLRCLYHGWLYDSAGRCLEQPGEPAGSTFHQRIRHPAYPCQELGGLIFAYLGEGEAPVLPPYEALTAPEEFRVARKYYQDCSYLQSVEGGIDPSHTSFLHRQFGRAEAGDRFRSAALAGGGGGGAPSINEGYAGDSAPRLEVETLDVGTRQYIIRALGPRSFLRMSNFVLPNVNFVPGPTGGDGYTIGWHVPIDDTHSWRYAVDFRRSAPIDKEALGQLESAEVGPDYHLVRNAGNRYLQDREEMRTTTFTGFGTHISVHDIVIIELQGPLQDRTEEHLGYGDKVIIAARQVLLKAVREASAGRLPPHAAPAGTVSRLPLPVVVSEMVPAGEDWRAHADRRIREEEATAARFLGIAAPEASTART